MARKYMEQCAKVMIKPMMFMGFEEWDLFIILAVIFVLFACKAPFTIILLIAGGISLVLRFGKRGKPLKAMEHYVQWFWNPKTYSAVFHSMHESLSARKLPKLDSIQEWLPYNSVEKAVVYFKDNSMAVGYELFCPDIESFSQDQLISHSQRIETLLSNLQGGNLTYQVIFTMDSDYSGAIEEHESIKSSNKLMKKIHEQRVNHLQREMNTHLLRRRRCILFVNYAVNSKAQSKGVLFLNESKNKKSYVNHAVNNLHRFTGLLKPIEESLQNVGIESVRMDTDELGQLLYKYLNPDRIKQGLKVSKFCNYEQFIDQICCSDLKVDDKEGEYIHFGGHYHKFVTLKLPPESTLPAMLSRLTALDFSEYDITVNLDIPTLEWAKNKLERYRKWAYGNLTGFFGIVNKDSEIKINQVEELIEELEMSDQRLIRLQMTVHVYGEELSLVKERTAKILSRLSDLNGAEGHNERWGAVLPIFIGSLPGWTKESCRQILMKTRNVADLLPFFSQFNTNDKAKCIFNNRTSGLVCFDPFSNELDAYNSVVIGSAGAGKSFTVQQIINQYGKDKIEIYIDLGSSYERLVKLKGGTYIPLGLKQKFTLNLFDLPKGKKFNDLDEESQQEILGLKTNTIGIMIGGFNQFKFGQIIEDYIAQSIRHMYTNVAQPILSDLKLSLKVLANEHDVWKENYSTVEGLLGIWCKGGQYGAFTDGKSTVSLDNNVIAFEMKGLSNFKKMQSVIFSVINNLVWSKVMSEPNLEKIVVCDEAWGLLSTPEGASFISECYRTSRKYKFSVISISQSLEEFRANKLLSAAILGNAHSTFILRQNNADSVKNIVEFFDFNEQERILIESLTIKKGEYSEVFLSQKKGMNNLRGVMRICPIPLELWMATTNRDDMNYFDEIRSENPKWDMYKVLEQCAKDYPKGVYQPKINNR